MKLLKNQNFFNALLIFSVFYYHLGILLCCVSMSALLHNGIGGDQFKNDLYHEGIKMIVIPGDKKEFNNFYAFFDFSFSTVSIPFQDTGRLRYKYSLKNRIYFDNGHYIKKPVSEFSEAKVFRIKQLKPILIDDKERQHIRKFKLYFASILFMDITIFCIFIAIILYHLINFRLKLGLILKMCLSLVILYVLFTYNYLAISYFYQLLSI